jgi:hypothetical protein
MKITKRDHELIGLIITPCEHSSKCGTNGEYIILAKVNPHLPIDNPLDVGYDLVLYEPQFSQYLVSFW